jgi:hypothetical protein
MGSPADKDIDNSDTPIYLTGGGEGVHPERFGENRLQPLFCLVGSTDDDS